ncbi:hypothetical protein LCGC14_2752860, partial [marine sediment metagenome]
WVECETKNNLVKYAAYVNAVIQNLPLVTEYVIYSPVVDPTDNHHQWDPIECYLEEWINEFRAFDVKVNEEKHPLITDIETLKKFQSTMIISTSDLRILKDFLPDIFSGVFTSNIPHLGTDNYVASI